MNKEKRLKMRQESDSHITITRKGEKLIDDGKITKHGKRKLG